MDNLNVKLAESFLKIDTIKVSPESPFTWASGWNSPIYCDNRKTLSHPIVRKMIYQGFAARIKEIYPNAEVIAGVATGAIAHGALVAEELGLPFIYVRSAPKGHGLENLIEGDFAVGQKVVIIEDLISTGGSSLKAAEALKNFGGDILGMLAIFTYNFSHAAENFEKAGIELTTLSDYMTLLEVALDLGAITADQKENLDQWRKDPANWRK